MNCTEVINEMESLGVEFDLIGGSVSCICPILPMPQQSRLVELWGHYAADPEAFDAMVEAHLFTRLCR